MSSTSSLHSLKLSSPFINGAPTATPLFMVSSSPLSLNSKPSFFRTQIMAAKQMQGRVVCATNDKTVNVRVVRLAPHPKYHRRVRKLKKYQAHDPDNQFKVGDYVLLQECRPISKTKSFLALPLPARVRNEKKEKKESVDVPNELGLPLESQQGEAAAADADSE